MSHNRKHYSLPVLIVLLTVLAVAAVVVLTVTGNNDSTPASP